MYTLDATNNIPEGQIGKCQGRGATGGATQTMLAAFSASLIAGAIWAALALLIAACIRRARARPFTGKYDMFQRTGQTTHGTVTIEYTDSWWRNLIVPTPALSVFAEHGSGSAPGTEDWRGVVEVLAVSDVASGFYWYPNGEGGALRFVLSRDRGQIEEFGTPHRHAEQAFVMVLKRRDSGQSPSSQN